MKYNYICIEREYGSGGTQIAHALSERLQIPCYGSEILEEVASQRRISVEQIQHYEEHVSNSLLYTLTLIGNLGNRENRETVLSPEDDIFLAEQAVIRTFAEQGPAIFLGHCANVALGDRFRFLNVFIRAEQGDKYVRIQKEYGIAPEDIEHTRKRFDKKRANYYFANTSKRWNDLTTYDMVLNSSTLGIQHCVTTLYHAVSGD